MSQNIMDIDGYKATIKYDSEIEMFRGEFIGLNGGADFYATDIDGLKREGELSLKQFLQMCEEDGVEPKKSYSGKIPLRIDAELHEKLVVVASSKEISVNKFISRVIEETVIKAV